MGGWGSTRWGFHSRRLRTDEAGIKVSARMVAPELADVAGRSAVVRVELPDSTWRLTCTSTRPNFGGRRWWLRCPGCGARRRTLYLRQERRNFACRSCLRLAYGDVTGGSEEAARFKM